MLPAVTPMFLAHVGCSGCHIKPKAVGASPESGATVAAATAQACDRCHKPGLGEQMIPMWQQNTKEVYDSVTAMLAELPPQPTGRPGELISQARDLLKLIRVDGSWGVHNPGYTEDLLQQARQKAPEAARLLQRPTERAP